jgi:hypothetical protein
VGKSLGNVRREQPSFPGKAQVEGDGSLLLLPEAGVPLHSLTVLSKPSVISMRKKMMAKKVDAGMLAMASAYVMKRRLGPVGAGDRRRWVLRPVLQRCAAD